ncbi:MAG: hypothetical protein JO040_06135 [Gemmatimonadetes bacterium]|nr:hypothetical protein [Gemmatimonadota bacterium]
MLRSVIAVLTGFLLIGALSVGADALLLRALPTAFDAAGRVDSVPVLLLIIGYVGIFAVSGCYLAARLAPRAPMRHALILGVLGLLFNVAGTIARWDSAPAWYHVVSLVLVLPYAWAGGRIREAELARVQGVPSIRLAV